ncbi:hypothetical protein BH20CHL6_BH20CHL6_17470 [soil metagenome]
MQRLVLRSLRTVDVSHHTLLDPLRLGGAIPQATALLARWRPDAIFTTGGYVAIPVLAAASALRIPALLWEGNMIPGRSVRATARLARAVAVSFETACAELPGPCYVTGTPIRSFSGLDRATARASFDIPPDARCLLVFGGSQAVRRLNEAVAAVLGPLLERCHVLHVTGEPAYADALRRREALAPAARERYRAFPFLRAEMGQALLAADLIVGRAGSSTLAEATALGLPIVVVPYPHAGGHQLANARLLEDAGAAAVVEDERFDGPALLEAAAILEDPERRAAMSTASRTEGRPGAARANSELLLALAERLPLPSPARIARICRAAA